MELHEYLEAVVDKSTFLAFVEQLEKDRRESTDEMDHFGRSENGWENHSIEDFLEAARAWGEVPESGAQQGRAAESPWHWFARFLYCGKIYE